MDDHAAAAADTTLRHRHVFDAAVERVFNAWTQPRALALWWCPAGWCPTGIEVDLRVGGAWRIAMRRENQPQCVAVHGRFLQVRPPTRLVYTWQWEGAFPGMPETQVTMDFRPLADGTEVVLRQEPLAMPYCVRHVAGWLTASERLSVVLAASEARRTAAIAS